MAKFVLSNIGRTSVGFTVYTPPPEGAEFMAQHKQRKFKNSGNIYINLNPNSSVDLIERTGMTVKELMDNPEVRELVRVKTDKVTATIEEDEPQAEEELKEELKEEPKEEPKEELKEKPKKKSKKKGAKGKEDLPPLPVAPPLPNLKEDKG